MALLTFKLNEKLYLRDPQHTLLGQNIISKSIELIDKMGFEQFTFKKLADHIESTEASVYRYFENKQHLLLYLISWYWNWMEFRIDKSTAGIKDASEKLRICLHLLAEEKKYDPTFEFVNEAALSRIVIAELDKTYLTKDVDEHNKDGLYGGFKSFCSKLASIALEINPAYPFSNALISSVALIANHQIFFASHLPSLSNFSKDNPYGKLYEFLERITFTSLNELKSHVD
jgi:AcrR family transcriptional regulator